MSNSMSRRSFLGSVVAATAMSTAAGAQNAAPAYVDVHTHITQEWGAKPALSAKDLLAWMDSKGIDQAVVMPLVSPESWDHVISTDHVLTETASHRDRLIPFCSIDPRTTNLNAQAMRDALARYRDAGAKGFGEHKTGIAINAPQNMALFEACTEVGLPVLFHLDTVRNFDEPGLPGLAEVLEAFPEGTFIGHAQGWWASISGDVTKEQMQQYPNTPVAGGGAIDALMDTYPNIYGDVSAGSGANAFLRDMDFARAFVRRRADRLLFGTDYLMPGQAVPQFDLFSELDMPEDVQAKVFRDNARRILGISAP